MSLYAWCWSCWLYDEGLDLTMSIWYYTFMTVFVFLCCLAFDFVSMMYENDIYAIDKGFMMIYSNGMKYDFKENVPFLNTCFCMVAILSTFLCWSHSSLLFTQSVGYGCLKGCIWLRILIDDSQAQVLGILKFNDFLCYGLL